MNFCLKVLAMAVWLSLLAAECPGGTPADRACAAIAVARAQIEIADEKPVLPDSLSHDAVGDHQDESEHLSQKESRRPPIRIVFNKADMIHETLPAQLTIGIWDRGCPSCKRLEREIKDQMTPLGWSVGTAASDQFRFVRLPETESVPRIDLFQNGTVIRHWDGYQDPSMLSRELRKAWDDAPQPQQANAFGSAGTIHARLPIRNAIRNFRQYVGEGRTVAMTWDRSAAQLNLFTAKEWTAKDLFGLSGRIQLDAPEAVNLCVKSVAFGYRLIGRDIKLDIEPITVSSLVDRIGPTSLESAKSTSFGLTGLDDALLVYNVMCMFRDLFSLLHPQADVVLSDQIAASAVLNGDMITVTFERPPSVKLIALFTFNLAIKRVVISESNVHVEFNGSRFVKSRDFDVKE